MTEEGAQILALLMDDCSSFEEEIVDGLMRSLERDVIGVDANAIFPSTSLSFSVCYLQSDSAYSLTSSSARVSDPDDVNANAIGCQCVCQLGYLMEASDEELGLSPPAIESSSTYFNEMVDLDMVGDGQDVFMGVELEGFPFLNPNN